MLGHNITNPSFCYGSWSNVGKPFGRICCKKFQSREELITYIVCVLKLFLFKVIVWHHMPLKPSLCPGSVMSFTLFPLSGGFAVMLKFVSSVESFTVLQADSALQGSTQLLGLNESWPVRGSDSTRQGTKLGQSGESPLRENWMASRAGTTGVSCHSMPPTLDQYQVQCMLLISLKSKP